MIFIFFIWLVSAIPLAFFDIKKSIAVLITYRLLVPFYSFSASGLGIEYNYVVLIVFMIFSINIIKKREKIDYAFTFPIIGFTVAFLLCIPFGGDLPMSIQFSFLRNFVLANFLVPIIIWQSYIKKQDLNGLINITIFCITIMGIYGLFCFAGGSNPYVKSLSVIFNTVDNNEIFAKKIRSGLAGKIQSTTYHPFFWSALLSLFLIVSNLFFKKKNTNYYIVFVLALLNLLICNVRTGILAFAVGLVVLLIFPSAKGRSILLGVLLFIILLGGLDLSFFGKYKKYVESIVFFYDPSKSIGGGSTYDMRETQFMGTMQLWDRGGFLFGNGFGWCTNYYQLHGDHPQLSGFESIIYVVIIDNGLMGIIIWSLFFFSLYLIAFKLAFKGNRFDFWVVVSMISAFIVFCLITGIFALNFFLIFLAIALRKITTDKQKTYIINLNTSEREIENK